MTLNKMFSESKIAAHMALKRTKCTSLCNAFGNYVAGKLSAIVPKFYDTVERKIKTSLLDLINIYDNHGSASGEALLTQ